LASTEGLYRVGVDMQHFRSIDAIQLPACALTIGSFDGVHVGHQVLIQQMVRTALANSIPPVVLTFFPHPSVVLYGRRSSFYLTSPDEKAARLGALGVEYVITQEFDHSLSMLRAKEFMQWVKDKLQVQMLWVGENFALGYKREGDVKFLKELSEILDFELHIVSPVLVEGELISSTRVREALWSGDVKRVARYLGQPFTLRGVVVQGASRGRRLGVPTANLKIWEEKAYPGAGVYACFSKVKGKPYKAVVNIGVRPTFNDDLNTPLVEAHLLDFKGNLYDKDVELNFMERLRKEQRFESPQELLEQIQQDIERTREILNQNPQPENQ
jgi:riboflavin kinase/FMN adenylyltransferase